MRIGIDVRILQTFNRHRGIGNYTHNQVGELLRLDRANEYLLFYEPSLLPPDLFAQVGTGAHWRAIPLELPREFDVARHRRGTADEAFRFASALDMALSRHALDVFHVTSPFEMHEVYSARRIDACRVVATAYDLIPLLFPEIYLRQQPASSLDYTESLKLLMRADRVLAISEATRRDVVDLLGVDSKRIDVVRPGVDPAFRVISDESKLEPTRSKLGIDGAYIFSVAGLHFTKNVEGVLASYSLLPPYLRERFRLVLTCPLSPSQRSTLADMARRYEIADRLIATGQIEQSDLVALYNMATVCLYPSLYDGWGLPVAEAMACGVPVVASNISSLPEVAGPAALTIDPTDSRGIADAVAQVLQDADLRERLRAAGLEHVRQFTWSSAATATLHTYEHVCAEPARFEAMVSWRKPLSIAYWSLLPPVPSGISDYSISLLASLSDHADVDVFVDGYQPTDTATLDRVGVYDYHAFPEQAARRRYDAIIYQMGNSMFHGYMYDALLARPGVVVMHDVGMEGFYFHWLAEHGQVKRFLHEVELNEGNEARREVERQLRRRAFDEYAYRMNRRIIAASRGLVTHSRWARDELARVAGGKPIAHIMLGTDVFQPDASEIAAAKLSLGLGAQTLVLGTFGRITRQKRVEAALRAFLRLRKAYTDSAFLIVGGVLPDMFESLPELVRQLGLEGAVRLTGQVPRLDPYLVACDVGINLRYPSAGETSATLMQLLGYGKPTILSDLPQFREFPDEFCPKVPVDEREVDTLTNTLLNLAANADQRLRMGHVARRFVREHATWDKVAGQYIKFIHELCE